MDQWISIAANIGTAVATSLVLLVLHEMKQQRTQADKPKFILGSVQKTLKIFWTKTERPFSVVLPLNCISKKVSEKKDSSYLPRQLSTLTQAVKLELINAGMGPAIEIKIDWTIKESINELTEELNKLNLGVFLKVHRHGLDIRHKKGQIGGSLTYHDGILHTEIPYSLPYLNVEVNKKIITIPEPLMLILHLMLYAKAIDYKKYNLPHLCCNVYFKDRVGRKYEHSFILEYSLLGLDIVVSDPPKPGELCAMLRLRISGKP